jgi:hypothetical protein
MKKITLNAMIIALLVLMNGVALYKYREYKNRQHILVQINADRNRLYDLNKIRIPENLKLVPNSPGLDSNLTKQLSKSEYSLIVLFEPTQCGACLDEKYLWNDIQKSGIVPVYAITYLKDKQELKKYLADSKTEVPVYQDTLALIGRSILPQGVPAKLLVNRKHQVVFVDYIRRTEPERKQFMQMIESYKNYF